MEIPLCGYIQLCTVRGHLNNRIVYLIEQRADLGRIDVLIRQRLCHDPAARSINRQMKLARHHVATATTLDGVCGLVQVPDMFYGSRRR